MSIVPEAARAEALAIVGKTGSGKSYTARGLVELELDAGRRVCVLDPTGVWWGLRAGAGKEKGFPVVIFGGEHADLPLNEANAAAVARVIAQGQFSAIVDLADMTMGARTRIATAFADELYKGNRAPLTLVADEADLFAPQRALPDQTVLLSRFEQIARRGRVRGFRLWTVTQRPAELHKSVLSQAATLIAMKLTAPQDRDAIGAWIEGQADRAQGKAMLADLPKLKVGEGYVWCPSHDILQKVAFPRIRTLDTMMSPEAGNPRAGGMTVRVIDIGALERALGDTAAEIADNDPRALKARIRELEKRLDRPKEPSEDLAREFQRGMDVGRNSFQSGIRHTMAEVITMMDCAQQALARARAELDSIDVEPIAGATAARVKPQSPPQNIPEIIPDGPGAKLTRAERLILTALAQYPNGRSKRQIAVLTGYAGSGGGFNNALSSLRQRGSITRDDPIQITDGGRAELGRFDPLPTGRQLLQHWLGQLGRAEREALETIANAYPRSITKDDVAARTGYAANGGGFNNALSRLRTLDLISGRGELRASDDLFN